MHINRTVIYICAFRYFKQIQIESYIYSAVMLRKTEKRKLRKTKTEIIILRGNVHKKAQKKDVPICMYTIVINHSLSYSITSLVSRSICAYA